MPDATRALERLDYTTVWEEHVLYFTPTTLRGCLERERLRDRIAGIASLYARKLAGRDRTGRANNETGPRRVQRKSFARAAIHARVPSYSRRIHERLRDRGRIAMLGAGHLTGAFVNLYGLAERIEFVADDNPNKQGLFMPGSRLPILPSSELVERDIDLCLMTVRPEIEEAVAAKNAAFTARGGRLASVFPDSPYSLDRVAARRWRHEHDARTQPRGSGRDGWRRPPCMPPTATRFALGPLGAAAKRCAALHAPVADRPAARDDDLPRARTPTSGRTGTRANRSRSTSSRANSTWCSSRTTARFAKSFAWGRINRGKCSSIG